MRGLRWSVAGAVLVALAWIVWLTRSPDAAVEEASSDQRAASLPLVAASERSAPAAPRSKPGPRIDAAQRAQLRAAIAAARTARQGSQEPSAANHAPPAEARAASREEQATARERIRAQIREVQPLLAECYELELARTPELAGSLQVRFTIEGEPDLGGIVGESDVTGGTLADRQEMATCVKETLFSVKFDPPEEGGLIVVEYPFVFGSK